MKHIRPINEFFDFLRKDGEEDKIALEFAKRLEKAKLVQNPYDIKKINKGDLPASFTSKSIYDIFYSVIFDDVTLITAFGVSSKSGGNLYKLMIDEEEINCKESYAKKIFNFTNEIYQRDLKRNKLDKLKSNINPAADLLEESTSKPTTADRLGLLQDLSVDLSDEGLYVKVSTDDPRFKRKTGEQYIYLRIDDNDKVFCKNYPKDDMDWLSTKPIINDFIKNLEGFGMFRDKDYKLYGGGTSVTLIFSGKGVNSIKKNPYYPDSSALTSSFKKKMSC